VDGERRGDPAKGPPGQSGPAANSKLMARHYTRNSKIIFAVSAGLMR
jgi:hypothetical protein